MIGGLLEPEPPMGGSVRLKLKQTPDHVGGDVMPGLDRVSRALSFWRMPSTSRAYPLALEKKADFYRRLFDKSDI